MSAMRKAPATPTLAPRDWLLVEASRRAEERSGELVVDDPATLRAAAVSDDPALQLVERARRRPGGLKLQQAVDRALAWLRGAVVAACLLGVLAGAATAAGLAQADGTIALSWTLLVLLLVPSLMLLLWLVLSLGVAGIGRDGAAAGLIGRLGWQLSFWLQSPRCDDGGSQPLTSALKEFGRNSAAVPMALATHGFWSGFFVGAIGALGLRFLALRYDFSWETTLLAGDTLAGWIAALGALPALLPGIEAPTIDQARAVLEGRSGVGERRLWAGYLLGCLLLYGLLPRLVLAAGFLWRWRTLRLPLNTALPGHRAVLDALGRGEARSLGPLGPAPPRFAARARAANDRRGGSAAPVALALELDTPPARRARLAADAEWLGSADDRDQRHRILKHLVQLRPRPAEIIALCSMARTPDRGTGAWLAKLDAIAPVRIRLVETAALLARGGEPGSRLEDWTRLAAQFGLAAPEQAD